MRHVVIILWIIVCKLLMAHSVVLASPLQFSNSFDGKATGILTSLVVSDNGAIWLGGENGLFGILGKKSFHFSDKNTLLEKSYVTDLKELNSTQLIVSIYGDGLYIFDTIERSFKKIESDDEELKSVWTVETSEHYIIVSTISNIYLINRKTLEIITDLRQMGVPLGNRVFAIGIDNGEQQIWWADEKKGVYSYSLLTEALVSFPLRDTFFDSKEISALHIEKLLVFVGTEKGLILLDPISNTTRLITERPKVVKGKLSSIKAIKRNASGELWVAAERLYIVDEVNNKFISPPQLYPVLAKGSLDVVLEIEFDNLGNVIALDTRKGMVIIPPQSEAVSYINDDLAVFSNRVASAKFVGNRILFTSDNTLATYDMSASTINTFKVPVTQELIIGKVDLPTVNLISKSGELYSVNLAENKLTKLRESIIYPSSSILELETNSHGNLVFIEEGEERDYLIVESKGSYKKLFSNAFSTLHISEDDEIYAAVVGEGIYKFENLNQTIKIGKESNFVLSSVVCLFEDHDGDIWACTSGDGVFKLKKGNEKFHLVNSIPANYIRAIGAIDQHWLLITTNIGLFLHDKRENKSYQLGNEFGIPDTDFAYKGIYTSDFHTLIAGDNLNYLINNKKLINSIQESSKKLHQAVISSFNSFDEDKNVVVPTGARFYEAIKSEEKLVLAHEEFIFEVGVTVANFLARDRLQIEYRLLGLSDEWTRSSDSTAQIVYSSLSFGHYTFEARVFDPRSELVQPISRLKIHVLPPFWLSNQAFVLYFLFMCVLVFHLYKRYRQKLALHGAELSSMVSDKQNALADSNLSIRRLLEHKQTLFTNISHELRTPLALVLGPLKQIQQKPNDAENAQRIDLALDNASKLEKLVDDLMEIEQIDKLCENESKLYDIKTNMSAIVASVQPLADYKEQEFICSIRGNGEISLIADSLEHICHNLISNAVKYTPPKGKIRVETTCQELHLVIKVTDTGCGISAEEIKRIFNRFSRAENKTDEVGSGIGLALVKDLVLANQGWIDVASKEGKGSTFTVYLPLVDIVNLVTTSTDKSAQCPVVIDAPEPETLPVGKSIILLVEDNDDMRSYLYSVLKQEYTCLLARHGIEAMNILNTISPSLIITDYMMPVMDGITLATKMKEKKETAHIPIILLTARGDKATAAKSLSRQIDHCVTKPVADDELILRVDNLLKLRQLVVKTTPATNESKVANNESMTIPTFACDKDQAFYTRFIAVIEKHYRQDTFNRTRAACELAVSERQLNRKLARLFDHNFTDFLKNYRLDKSRALLRRGEQVTPIALDVGFNSTSYFSSCFKARYGMSPTQYQDTHTQEQKRA